MCEARMSEMYVKDRCDRIDAARGCDSPYAWTSANVLLKWVLSNRLTIRKKTQFLSWRSTQTPLPLPAPTKPCATRLTSACSSARCSPHLTTSRARKMRLASDSSMSPQSSYGGGEGPCGTTVSRRMRAHSANDEQIRRAQLGQPTCPLCGQLHLDLVWKGKY